MAPRPSRSIIDDVIRPAEAAIAALADTSADSNEIEQHRDELKQAQAEIVGPAARLARIAPDLAPLVRAVVVAVGESAISLVVRVVRDGVAKNHCTRPSYPSAFPFEPRPVREAVVDLAAAFDRMHAAAEPINDAEPAPAHRARLRDPDAQVAKIIAYLAQHEDAMGLSDAKLAEASGVTRPTLIRLMKNHPKLERLALLREKPKKAKATVSKRRGSRDTADMEALGKLRRCP